MKVLYLETSALARAYVEGEAASLDALARARIGRRLYTSALTELEVRRAILRLRQEKELSQRAAADILATVLQLLQQVDVVPLGPAVLARAGDVFPLHVRSLDALHLATAVLIHQRREVEEVVVFSRDNRVRENAAALGMVLA